MAMEDQEGSNRNQETATVALAEFQITRALIYIYICIFLVMSWNCFTLLEALWTMAVLIVLMAIRVKTRQTKCDKCCSVVSTVFALLILELILLIGNHLFSIHETDSSSVLLTNTTNTTISDRTSKVSSTTVAPNIKLKYNCPEFPISINMSSIHVPCSLLYYFAPGFLIYELLCFAGIVAFILKAILHLWSLIPGKLITGICITITILYTTATISFSLYYLYLLQYRIYVPFGIVLTILTVIWIFSIAMILHRRGMGFHMIISAFPLGSLVFTGVIGLAFRVFTPDAHPCPLIHNWDNLTVSVIEEESLTFMNSWYLWLIADLIHFGHCLLLLTVKPYRNYVCENPKLAKGALNIIGIFILPIVIFLGILAAIQILLIRCLCSEWGHGSGTTVGPPQIPFNTTPTSFNMPRGGYSHVTHNFQTYRIDHTAGTVTPV